MHRFTTGACAVLAAGCLAGCATGSGADLNRAATVEDLEARIEVLEEKVNQSLKSLAAAKVDAATALRLISAQEQ